MEPKQCLLKVAIISRPFGDPAINEVVWKTADEQIIPPKERHAWEVNGLRVGRIIGELPLELEAIMKDTTSHQKVTPTNFMVASGDPTLIKVSDPVADATVLVNRDNRIWGNDRQDVSGYFRATAQHEGANNVSLRLVPEVHFGPIKRTFQTVPERGGHRCPGVPDQQRPGRRHVPRAGHQLSRSSPARSPFSAAGPK